MNIVVVVIDALRASDVGCLGRDAETTPHIDSLADNSMVFERAFSVSNYTDVCMSTILSGKPPREHGVTHHGTAHTEENLARIEQRAPQFLPEILHDHGYNTIGVDWMGRWHEWGYDNYGVDGGGQDADSGTDSISEAIFDRITDTVVDLPEPLLFPIMKQYYRRVGYNDFRVNCEELTDIAIDRIDDSDSPTFTLLHYWDVHPPYLPPEKYESQFTGEDRPDESLEKYFGTEAKGPMSAAYQTYATGKHTTMSESKAAYDGAIKWVDEQFGRLVTYLRETNKLDETMIVVTADHGHNFGEHGIFSDNTGLYDTSVHVPLIIHDPRRDHRRVDGLVQHTDIVPTILDFAGIEAPTDLRGNVLPDTREFAFAEAIEHRMQMVRTDDWKLIIPRDLDYLRHQYWYDGDGETELYDLTEDPDETKNIANEHPDVISRLTNMLEAELETQERIVEEATDRSAAINDNDMDEIKSRLNALGYADDDNV
ncbi:sulfatase family protein [Natrinema limicola]|nr:sulfatase [Natrinema limicola]